MACYPSSVDNFQLKLIKALGLPKTAYNLSIRFSANGLGECSCDFYLTSEMIKEIERLYTEEAEDKLKVRPLRKIDNGGQYD